MKDVAGRAGESMAIKKIVRSAKAKAPAKTKRAEKDPEVSAEAEAKPRISRSKSTLVKKLLKAAERKVTAEDVKATISDVIRLLQLQKELESEEPREIKVQWIEREVKVLVPDK